jgi:hypothetical protein
MDSGSLINPIETATSQSSGSPLTAALRQRDSPNRIRGPLTFRSRGPRTGRGCYSACRTIQVFRCGRFRWLQRDPDTVRLKARERGKALGHRHAACAVKVRHAPCWHGHGALNMGTLHLAPCTLHLARCTLHYFAYLFLGSFPTMCSRSLLFSLQMYSISSVFVS